MNKTTLFLLELAVLLITAPLNSPKASATIENNEDITQQRPPLTIRNATDSVLMVTFSPSNPLHESPPYTWHIAPKAEGQDYNEARLTSYAHGPSNSLSTDLTENDRYGVLTIFESSEVEVEEGDLFVKKDTIIFSRLVDTSAFFSFYPKNKVFYALEEDTTLAGTTAPQWLVEQLQERLFETSLLDLEMTELREKWASMTSDEKENPFIAGFPSCLHGVDFTLPIPSQYILRPKQTQDLQTKLRKLFPTDEELRTAEKELITEGIKIFAHE